MSTRSKPATSPPSDVPRSRCNSEFWGAFAGRDSVVLDRATARVIAEHQSDPGGHYDLNTTLVETVDEIPADVRTAFQRSDNGERVYGASSTAP